MRHTLRQMVDGDLAGIRAASPAAKNVAETIQDPVGTTKEGFEDLQQKQLEYELAKQNMKRQLAGPQAVIDHVKQTHGLDENQNGIPDDQEMGYQDPNMPGNMQQMPGKMQQNFPAANKNVPGAGPGLAQPSKPMVGKPGMPMMNQPGMPPRGPSPIAQPGMQNPAAKPTGQTNPPAKGGKPPAKKEDSGRGIKVHVSANTPVRDAVGLRQMESAVAQRNMTSCIDGCGETKPLVKAEEEDESFSKATVSAGGAGSGCHGPNCGRPASSGGGKSSDGGTKVIGKPVAYAQKLMRNNPKMTFEQIGKKVADKYVLSKKEAMAHVNKASAKEMGKNFGSTKSHVPKSATVSKPSPANDVMKQFGFKPSRTSVGYNPIAKATSRDMTFVHPKGHTIGVWHDTKDKVGHWFTHTKHKSGTSIGFSGEGLSQLKKYLQNHFEEHVKTGSVHDAKGRLMTHF